MAEHLNESRIKKLCEILDGWRGELTWEALADASEPLLGHRYSRQSLYSHEALRRAFEVRKTILRNQNQVRQKRASNLETALDRIERLTSENARLKAENTALLEKFATWCYNTYANPNGIPDESVLNKPLPLTDRDRSLERKRPVDHRKTKQGGPK